MPSAGALERSGDDASADRAAAHSGAVVPERDERKLRKDKRAVPHDKPDAGKTTRLGRKVESPASIKTAGPSGQRGDTQHQKQHTNK
ncbi:hypothetical protein [Ramlibacter rhizophilus]|uniref:hypothetical protein n=1 Tax=Ramlibacter rhizophilus TaxID=1781167 RepID=UPI00143230C1|nr:hypothetical protein [Ramlibacter rhizophilus]